MTHIGSWEWNLATDSVTWSDELYRIFGLAPQSTPVTYGVFLDHVHPDDRALIVETVGRALTDRRPFSVEHRITLRDGRERLLRGRGRVMLDEAGAPERMVGTAQDITEQRHAENLRDDILSTVSHELRTPARCSARLLHEPAGTVGRSLGEQADAALVDKIVGQARRLDRILSDLLDVDRHRHGLIVPTREPTDVTELVGQIAAAHRATEHAITVSAEPTTANIDAPKVERIVDNLLVNAVKHTPPGTPISLRLALHGEDLLIIVDDDGPGIPDELKSEVFEIFDRGASVETGEPGTGDGPVARGPLCRYPRRARLGGGQRFRRRVIPGAVAQLRCRPAARDGPVAAVSRLS